MTVKSSEDTNTVLPPISPYPVTTPSPGTLFLSSPKSSIRDSIKLSTSTKVPGSKSRSILSLAVSLPLLCCFSIRSCPPACRIRFLFLSRALILSFHICYTPLKFIVDITLTLKVYSMCWHLSIYFDYQNIL